MKIFISFMNSFCSIQIRGLIRNSRHIHHPTQILQCKFSGLFFVHIAPGIQKAKCSLSSLSLGRTEKNDYQLFLWLSVFRGIWYTFKIKYHSSFGPRSKITDILFSSPTCHRNFQLQPPLSLIIILLRFLPLSSFRRHCQVTFESFHLKKDWRRFFFWRRCLLLTLPQALTFECFYCSLPNIFPFLCVLKVFIWKLLDNKAGLTRGHKSLPQKPRKAKKENVTKAWQTDRWTNGHPPIRYCPPIWHLRKIHRSFSVVLFILAIR